MIHQLEIDLTIEFLTNLAKKAMVTIDGQEEAFPISKTVREGDVIKRYIVLEDELGLITESRLVDSQGRTLESHSTNVEKGPDGFMIAFFTKLQIVGGVK